MDMAIADHIESALNALVPGFSVNHGPIKALSRLSGGASHEIWSFKLAEPGKPEKRYILRRTPNGASAKDDQHKLDLLTEAKLLHALRQSGLKVPEINYICAPEDQLGSAYIMGYIEGETIPRKIHRDPHFSAARNFFSRDCGAALAGIHQTPLTDLPKGLSMSSGTDQLDTYEGIYRGLEIPSPVFELAFQTLKTSSPRMRKLVLTHGDFRLGNLMVNETGLCAILDWELTHIGDPREDIGWICVNSWRFGASEKRVGGIDTLETLLEAYQRAGGDDIAGPEIDWWEMLGTLKWGIMCMIMYDTYRTGLDTSVERVAIGRRVSETEIDLLNLMERL